MVVICHTRNSGPYGPFFLAPAEGWWPKATTWKGPPVKGEHFENLENLEKIKNHEKLNCFIFFFFFFSSEFENLAFLKGPNSETVFRFVIHRKIAELGGGSLSVTE